jgi:hypothetical protein
MTGVPSHPISGSIHPADGGGVGGGAGALMDGTKSSGEVSVEMTLGL